MESVWSMVGLSSSCFVSTLTGGGVVLVSRFPYLEYMIPPRKPARRTRGAERMPVAICGKTVPGQAPVSAIPQPKRTPPMILPSYLENRSRDFGVIGFAAEKLRRFARMIRSLSCSLVQGL